MKRINVLDPLRGVASLAVVWFHLAYASSYVEHGHWIDSSGRYGKLGVQVFFVISGFVLPYALRGRDYRLSNYFSFVSKRVVRLDPPYLVTILGVLFLSFVSTFVPGWRGEFSVTWMQLAGHLAYLNAFLGLPWLVSVFWTLAIEFQYYLLVALVYPALVHPGRHIRYIMLLSMCAMAVFFSHEGPTSFKPYVFQHIFLFAMGIVTFWSYCGLVPKRTFWVLVAGCAFGTAVTLGIAEMIAGLASVCVVVLFPHLRAGRLLTYLGTVSYSLYLVHLPVGDRVLGLAERIPAIPKPIGVLLGVAASIIAADLLYRLVERPSQRLSSAIEYRNVPLSPSEKVVPKSKVVA